MCCKVSLVIGKLWSLFSTSNENYLVLCIISAIVISVLLFMTPLCCNQGCYIDISKVCIKRFTSRLELFELVVCKPLPEWACECKLSRIRWSNAIRMKYGRKIRYGQSVIIAFWFAKDGWLRKAGWTRWHWNMERLTRAYILRFLGQ